MMNTAMEHVTVLPSTRDEVENFVAKLREEIEDPIAFAVQLRAMDEVVKQCRADETLNDWITEALDRENGSLTVRGNLIEKAETGIKFDYQGDAALMKLEETLAVTKAKIKARQSVIKAGGSKLPAVRSSRTSYKITLR
jgi:hypothetical protein